MEQDKRKHPRFKIDQIIRLTYGNELFIQASGINISEGGVFCRTMEYVEPYTKVLILMEAATDSGEMELSSEGMVTRIEDDGEDYLAAIEFSSMNESDKEKLKKYFVGEVTE
jgi:c-di-GMP-binding flagellar brake protein YcgR